MCNFKVVKLWLLVSSGLETHEGILEIFHFCLSSFESPEKYFRNLIGGQLNGDFRLFV